MTTPTSNSPVAGSVAADFKRQFLKRLKSVRAEVLRVFKHARDPDEWQQFDLFRQSDKRHIARRLKQISHEPKVPQGRDREYEIAQRLSRVVNSLRRHPERLPERFVGRLGALSNAYRDTRGRYYTMKELRSKDKPNPNENVIENWAFQRERAEERGDDEVAWACGVALSGGPKPISDFIIQPLYILRRADERQFRLVDLRNTHGEECKAASVGARQMSITNDFREWLNNQSGGSFNFLGGHVELQEIGEDIGADLAWRFVKETSRWGWQPIEDGETTREGGHTLSGLWVFGDGIICNGRVMAPDRHGIYWIGPGQGWLIGARDLLSARNNDEKGEPWHQDVPCMGLLRRRKGTNGREALEMEYLRAGKEPGTWTSAWAPPSESEEKRHVEELRRFAASYFHRVRETVGGEDAGLAMGSVAVFAAGPEVFRDTNQWTGLWLHGEAAHGKNTVMRWVCKMFGLPSGARDGLRCDSTEASLGTMLSQYSHLPCWVDEYMPRLGPWVDALLKGNFNKTARGKMTLGTGRRDWLGGIVMTAQHTSTDAAVASRYVQVQISKYRRAKDADGETVNHVDWMQDHMRLFHLVGRQLLLERERFTARITELMSEWSKHPEVAAGNHRSAFVYGLAWSGYLALRELLGIPLNEGEQIGCLNHAVESRKEAEREVSNRVDADLVIRDLVGAIELGAAGPFGQTREELRRFFVASEVDELHHPPNASDQQRFGRWKSYEIWFNTNTVWPQLQTHVRRQDRHLALRVNDLRAQLSSRSFWLTGSTKRFVSGTSHAWGFKLDDLREYGYQPVDTVELLEHLLFWAADLAGRRQGEEILTLNGQDPIEVDIVALSKLPMTQMRFEFKSADGAVREELLSDWRIEDWPDPRRGSLYALAQRLTQRGEG